MRTSDQGLLAKLGFQDADRENPRHDKACRFFTRPDIAEKLLNVVFPVGRAWRQWGSEKRQLEGLWTTWEEVAGYTEGAVRSRSGFHIGFIDAAVRGNCKLMAPGIPDGSDDDVYWAGGVVPPRIQLSADEASARLRAFNPKDFNQRFDFERRLHPYIRLAISRCGSDWDDHVNDAITRVGETHHGFLSRFSVIVNVEVKIGRTATSEIIRQIETYRGGEDGMAAEWVLAVDYVLQEEECRALTDQRIIPIRLGPAFEAYLLEADAEAPVVRL
jgi:hypothetical protein